MLASLLQALGVDSTFFIQFGCFLLFYPILSRGLFQPYFRIQNQREKETIECMKEVETLKATQQDLKVKYTKKARELQEKFNLLYNKKSRLLKEAHLKRQAENKEHFLKEYEEKSKILSKQARKAEDSLQPEIKFLTKTAVEHLIS